MRRIARDLYVPAAVAAFGDPGGEALRELIVALRALFQRVEPELITGSLVVFHRVSRSTSESRPTSKRISDIELLVASYAKPFRSGMAAIELDSGGHFHLYLDWGTTDLLGLSKAAIIYEYRSGSEQFYIGGEEKAIYNPSAGVHASVFAIPTFRDLKAALEDYRTRFVSTSQCPLFAKAWLNSSRLILQNKPERAMRRSLTHYLKTVLRTAEVRPEQVVDESHPIDIKVSWLFTTRLALIEIKWVGDSVTTEGNLLPYRDARARDGAKQLADYLDANETQAPMHETIGYLVVIDARRRGLDPDTTQLSHTNAFWYSDQEIEYEPSYHEFRPDFAEPVRMFAQPLRSACRPD